MSLMGGLALLGVVVVAWCSYLDVRDIKRRRQLERRWDEIESQIREDIH